MNAFAAWGLTILGLAIITTIAEMLLPQGRTRNVIRSVAATVATLVIVTPLPSLLRSGFDFEFSGDEVTVDSDYLAYIDGVKANTFASAAKEHLKSKGLDGDYKIEVTVDGFYVKSVKVNFADSIMNGNITNINKSEIIKSIADYFDIDEEAVMAYG